MNGSGVIASCRLFVLAFGVDHSLEESQMNAFLTALFYVFIAEIGDKTQLLTIAFTSKHRPLTVLSAVGVASLLVNFIAVALGAVTGKFLPMFWINLLAGIAFVSFGLLELRKDDERKKRNAQADGDHFSP